MEYKYISSTFTVQIQTNFKNTKIQTCLHGLFPWDISFQSSVKKHIPPKCLITAKDSDIREVSIALI